MASWWIVAHGHYVLLCSVIAPVLLIENTYQRLIAALVVFLCYSIIRRKAVRRIFERGSNATLLAFDSVSASDLRHQRTIEQGVLVQGGSAGSLQSPQYQDHLQSLVQQHD